MTEVSGLDVNTNNITITFIFPNGKVQCSKQACRLVDMVNGTLQLEPTKTEFNFPLLTDANVMRDIVTYLEYYKDKEPKVLPKPLPSTEYKDWCDPWDATYLQTLVGSDIKSSSEEELAYLREQRHFQIMLYANFLRIEPLKLLACARFAVMLKTKSFDDIKKLYRITKTLTAEEEKKIREMHPEFFEWLRPKN